MAWEAPLLWLSRGVGQMSSALMLEAGSALVFQKLVQH